MDDQLGAVDGESGDEHRPAAADGLADGLGENRVGAVAVGRLHDDHIGCRRVGARQQQLVLWPTEVAGEENPGFTGSKQSAGRAEDVPGAGQE